MPLDASLKSTANLVPEFFKERHGTVGALLPDFVRSRIAARSKVGMGRSREMRVWAC